MELSASQTLLTCSKPRWSAVPVWCLKKAWSRQNFDSPEQVRKRLLLQKCFRLQRKRALPKYDAEGNSVWRVNSHSLWQSWGSSAKCAGRGLVLRKFTLRCLESCGQSLKNYLRSISTGLSPVKQSCNIWKTIWWKAKEVRFKDERSAWESFLQRRFCCTLRCWSGTWIMDYKLLHCTELLTTNHRKIFPWFVNQVTENKRKGDLDPEKALLAEVFKLLGNSLRRADRSCGEANKSNLHERRRKSRQSAALGVVRRPGRDWRRLRTRMQKKLSTFPFK